MKQLKNYQMPDPVYARQPPSPVIVPYWMNSFMTLNKLNAEDLINIKKIAQYLSQDDLLEFYAVNLLFYEKLGGYYPLAMDDTIQQRLETESSKWRSEVIERLKLQEGLSLQNNETYKIRHLDEKVFLIYVEQGILNTLGYREGALAFVSDCLKAQFSYAPIHEVHLGALYRYYLDLINPKIPFLFLTFK